MEKIVEFIPAFDKRNSDPSKNYGIHGVDLRMILKGDKGAVQFVVYTNWHLPHVQKEMNRKVLGQDELYVETILNPMPADLGYHSFYPMYEGQGICSESCDYLDGKPCYYDGSGLNAERMYKVLLEKGSDGVWRELEDYYNKLFNQYKT
jgi:hypothetical protein